MAECSLHDRIDEFARFWSHLSPRDPFLDV
jgi:hypothetical protein